MTECFSTSFELSFPYTALTLFQERLTVRMAWEGLDISTHDGKACIESIHLTYIEVVGTHTCHVIIELGTRRLQLPQGLSLSAYLQERQQHTRARLIPNQMASHP